MSPVRERRRRIAPAGAFSKAGRSACAGEGTQGGIADEKGCGRGPVQRRVRGAGAGAGGGVDGAFHRAGRPDRAGLHRRAGAGGAGPGRGQRRAVRPGRGQRLRLCPAEGRRRQRHPPRRRDRPGGQGGPPARRRPRPGRHRRAADQRPAGCGPGGPPPGRSPARDHFAGGPVPAGDGVSGGAELADHPGLSGGGRGERGAAGGAEPLRQRRQRGGQAQRGGAEHPAAGPAGQPADRQAQRRRDLRRRRGAGRRRRLRGRPGAGGADRAAGEDAGPALRAFADVRPLPDRAFAAAPGAGAVRLPDRLLSGRGPAGQPTALHRPAAGSGLHPPGPPAAAGAAGPAERPRPGPRAGRPGAAGPCRLPLPRRRKLGRAGPLPGTAPGGEGGLFRPQRQRQIHGAAADRRAAGPGPGPGAGRREPVCGPVPLPV